MKTEIVRVDSSGLREEDLNKAVKILSEGGLVVIPTETVYGIAADMSNQKALERLCEIKKRPKDKPFSLHVDNREKIELFAKDIPGVAYKLIDEFWPGPLTVILSAQDKNNIYKHAGSIGIRMPDNEVALKVIGKTGVPVVCPSANISGKPAPTSFEEAIRDLGGLVDFAIDAGRTSLGIESTVVDLTVEPLKILRQGALRKEEIEAVAKRKLVLFVCTGNSCRSVMAKGLLEKELSGLSRQDVKVLSAGIMMLSGLGATNETAQLLKKDGIDVFGHRSQGITKEMLKRSDIILVMEKIQEERILELVPEVKNKLFLLKEFAKIKDNNLNIADPIGKTREFYEQTFRTIKEAVKRVSNII